MDDHARADDGSTRGLDGRLQSSGQRLDGQHQSQLVFVAGKIRRHLRWARTEGIGKLIEEDELDPRVRVSRAWRKAQWRRQHGVAGAARAVFLVGLQRSGTNMVARGLDGAPEFEVHNENDRAAFVRFRLRDDAVVQRLITASPHRFVLFKPLCDSHRTVQLLERHSRPGAPAVAVWAFRDPDGRARSAVAKFGDNDRTVLQALNQGLGDGLWQTQSLSDQVRSEVASLDVAGMTPFSASALFWWARNSLFFDLGLHRRSDVVLVSYQQFVREPQRQMAAICRPLGLAPRPSLISHVDDRSTRSAPPPLSLHPRVRELCDALLVRLEEHADRQASLPPVSLPPAGSAPGRPG